MIPRPGYLPLRVGPTFFPASSPPRSPSPTHGPPPLRVVPVARPALLHTGFGWPALGLVSILAGQGAVTRPPWPTRCRCSTIGAPQLVAIPMISNVLFLFQDLWVSLNWMRMCKRGQHISLSKLIPLGTLISCERWCNGARNEARERDQLTLLCQGRACLAPLKSFLRG